MKHVLNACFGSSSVGTAASIAGIAQLATGTITEVLEWIYLILGIIGAIGTIAGLVIGIIQRIKKDLADGKITPEEAAGEIQQIEDSVEEGKEAIGKVIDEAKGKEGNEK